MRGDIIFLDEDVVANSRLRTMLELLLLEDSFLPLVMNWAAEEDWSDLLLFLLETDSLRYPSISTNKESAIKSRFIQDPFALARIVNSYIAPSDSEQSKLRVGDLISLPTLNSIERLTAFGIPLAAVFSIICEKTWQKILTFGENLPYKKYVWPALQKSIVEDTKFELVTVLTKPNYQSFLVTYLQHSPAESACLKCWLQVRNILDALETFKYPTLSSHLRDSIVNNRASINMVIEHGGKLSRPGSNFSNGSGSGSGSVQGSETPDSTINAPPLVNKRNSWKKPVGGYNPYSPSSSMSMLNSSVSVRRESFTTGRLTAVGAPLASNATMQSELGMDYFDPMGAFALLLIETRRLHKKFFYSSVPSISMSSSWGANDYNNMSHGSNISNNSGSSIFSHKASLDSPSHSMNVPCAGPSETLRLELTATLAQTSSVQTADVEAIESFYAMTFAGRIEKLLCSLERETFQHLQLRYPLFLASPEYVLLLAQEKTLESKKVHAYRSFNSFLEFVKKNNEGSFLHGMPTSGGATFDFSKYDSDLKDLLLDKIFVFHGNYSKYLINKNKSKSKNNNDNKNDNKNKSRRSSQNFSENQNDINEVSAEPFTERVIPNSLGITSLKGIFGTYEIEDEGTLASTTYDEEEEEEKDDGEEDDEINMKRTDMESLSDLYPCLAKKLVSPLPLPSCALNDVSRSRRNTHSARSSIIIEDNLPTVMSSFNNDDFNTNQIGEFDKSVSMSSNFDKGSNKSNIKNSSTTSSRGGKARSRRNSNDDIHVNTHEKILKNVLGEKSMDEKISEEEEKNACKHLPFMLDSLSPRTCVQLAMLLCTNKTVIVVSLSKVLPTAVLAALPLLVKPLVPCKRGNILPIDSIDVWWVCYKNEYIKSLNQSVDPFSNQRKSWVSPFKNNSGSYAENGRATATDLRTSISTSIPISTTGSSFSYLTPSLTRSAIPPPSFAPPSRTSKNFLSSADGNGQLGGSGWLIAADSIDFYSSQMFRDFQIVSNLQANGICVFDLDTMMVISPKGPDIDSSTSTSTSFPSTTDTAWWRDVLRSKTFQCYNSHSFRTLHIQSNKLLDMIKNKKYIKKETEISGHIINVKNHLEEEERVEDVVQEEEGGKRRRKEGGGGGEDSVSNMKNKKAENKNEEKDNGLLGKIFQLSVTCLEEVNEAEMRQEYDDEIKQISIRIVRAFHQYFTAIFYHALPASILYYPTQLVVGCDLKLFQSHLAATREKNKNKNKDKNVVIEGVEDTYGNNDGGGNETKNENENETGDSVSSKRSDSPIPFVSKSSTDGIVSTGSGVQEGGIGIVLGVGLKSKSNDSNMTGERSPRGRGKMQVPFSSNTEEDRGSHDKNKEKEKDINRDKGTIKLKGKDRESNKEKEKEKERNAGRKKGENDQIVGSHSDDGHFPSLVQSSRGYTPFAAADNVEEAFSHLVADSPVFIELLKRHGTILQYFRF